MDAPDLSDHLFSAAACTHHLGNNRQKRSKLTPLDDAVSSGSKPIPKPKYYRKPDPGAPKITRPCSECGKTFWSWKALFGHMRCHPERHWRGINPPPDRRREPPSPPDQFYSLEFAMTAEDQEVAESLLFLANGGGKLEETLNAEAEEGTRFECSSCKKVFGTHQALGGHRASHKNVKGCFAMTRSGESEQMRSNMSDEKVVMMHRCGICLRVFSSGQALGGHKRCHWEEASVNHGYGFDLNLPPPAEETVTSSESYSSGLTLGLRLGL